MARIILAWGLWGPYHAPRFEALKRQAENQGDTVLGLSLFSASSVNRWALNRMPEGVLQVKLSSDEAGFPLVRAGSLFSVVRRLKPDVILLPSYWHWSLVLNLAGRFAGGRVVMMNDSHAGTAKATGLAHIGKRRIVSSFHAALVGGQPHKRYFASLGLSPEAIFTGYDAVDNDYFASRAREIRCQAFEVRLRYALPERYFLSVGRFVAKKNLATLVRAYRKYLELKPQNAAHLVLVGSGEEEAALRSLCAELCVRVYDKTRAGHLEMSGVPQTFKISKDGCLEHPHATHERGEAGIHFYGFRHIDELPHFYALAMAFVLPSLQEEWGLVVNEAMASGLPVLVSERAGCAEDLLEPGPPVEEQVAEAEHLRAEVGLTARIRRNGFVFEPESVEELSRILLLADSSQKLLTVMGKNSRHIVEKFSCENFARNALLAARAALGKRGCAADHLPNCSNAPVTSRTI